MNYAYEGEVKIPLSVRFQNAITKLITAIKKFILKIRSIKKEHVVPKKVLDAYRSLSRMCYNCMNRCKNSLLTGESARVIFTEPFESQEYKILFSDEIKEKAKPGEYVKIASSEVLNFMNVSLTIISNAKQGLRTIDKEAHPNRTQSFTQLINYAKFMLKISNRVLSYKNMYVEKRHLPTTKVEESEGVNESYLFCMNEIDIAMEGIFGNLFKKKNSEEAIALHAIEEVHPIDPLYSQFVTVAINYDPRNLFRSNKSIPNNVPSQMHEFYMQCEPINVCLSYNGNNINFIPLNEMKHVLEQYPNIKKSGRFLFATINADPVYFYNGKICTTYHADSKVRDVLVSPSLKHFLQKLILENGSKKNW